MSDRVYHVNEVFRALQGEGLRAGELSVFLRFSRCNLRCTKETAGFDCDTEFMAERKVPLDELVKEVLEVAGLCRWVVFTGGEPGFQVDRDLVRALHAEEFQLAIETNGTVRLARQIDWITVSPKTAEHTIKQLVATEVKYVRGYGQELPRTPVDAEYKLLSPAFDGDQIDRRALGWCMELIARDPSWRLSVQMHKAWGIR